MENDHRKDHLFSILLHIKKLWFIQSNCSQNQAKCKIFQTYRVNDKKLNKMSDNLEPILEVLTNSQVMTYPLKQGLQFSFGSNDISILKVVLFYWEC